MQYKRHWLICCIVICTVNDLDNNGKTVAEFPKNGILCRCFLYNVKFLYNTLVSFHLSEPSSIEFLLFSVISVAGTATRSHETSIIVFADDQRKSIGYILSSNCIITAIPKTIVLLPMVCGISIFPAHINHLVIIAIFDIELDSIYLYSNNSLFIVINHTPVYISKTQTS